MFYLFLRWLLHASICLMFYGTSSCLVASLTLLFFFPAHDYYIWFFRAAGILALPLVCAVISFAGFGLAKRLFYKGGSCHERHF